MEISVCIVQVTTDLFFVLVFSHCTTVFLNIQVLWLGNNTQISFDSYILFKYTNNNFLPNA